MKNMVPENFAWIKRRKELLENISKFENKADRIQTVTQLSYMHNALHESVLGWQNWVNGWISIELSKRINVVEPNAINLTNKELAELHGAFKDFALKFIEFDLKYTELINKKLLKKKKSFPYTNSQEKELFDDKYKGMIV